MTEYKTDTGMIYAVRQQPEGGWRIMCHYPGAGWAMTTDPRLSAECSCAESLQEVLDAYAPRRGWAVYDPPEASPTSPAAATAAAGEPASPPAEPAPANTTAEPAAGGSEPEANALAEHPVTSELSQQPAAFDYSGLDAQTVADLHLAEREYAGGKRMAEMGLRRMADGVAIAHDALCGTVVHNVDNGQFDKKEDTFRRWCESVGVGKSTAYKLLHVSYFLDQSTPEEQKLLEQLSPSLLYAGAKPSADPEMVQDLKDGKISTLKEWNQREAELKAQLKAKSDELAAEKSRADSLSAEIGAREEKISELLEASEQADQRANQAETRIKGLEDSYRSAHANEEFAIRRAADAESRATRAEQKAAELEARPIEVAVQRPSDADLARWRAEGAEQAKHEAAASIASADAARKKAEDRIKKLQETLQGRTDHLNAVEAELAQLKAQLKAAPSSKPAPGCAPACIPCTECAYEDSCCGLSFLGDIPEEDDAINARLTGCTAGKRKGRPA